MDATRDEECRRLRNRWRTLLELRLQHRHLLREVMGAGAPAWVDRAVAREETQMLDALDAREARALAVVERELAPLPPPDSLPRCSCHAARGR
ncbi:hypothetical protein [Corallococcus exercitus]|uniref:Uncharacterized protein n=1 Tax=Corallococcus exercitus TaxID=2316736 RepID=A0A7Y4JYZ2_9BACT|nr:hypothetical protein [Corallococcus exercitus]NOK12857.1 hypothetical protein [Corallococcus exercitus]